jgi:hypothetical protein
MLGRIPERGPGNHSGFGNQLVKSVLLLSFMRRFFAVVLLTLIVGLGAQAQNRVDRPNVWSEELNFLAEFPDEPKETSAKLETRFGTAEGKSWKLERSDITFEISVLHFAEPPVEMKMKALQEFYRILCRDIIGSPHGGYGDNFFGEEGMSCANGIEKRQDLYLRLFLIRNRLYLAKVISTVQKQNASARHAQATHFLESLHLANIDPVTKKLVYGMPKAFSQNLELW